MLLALGLLVSLLALGLVLAFVRGASLVSGDADAPPLPMAAQ
ncbi:MAG: hypothetical protein ACRDHF_00520 [Tepidiformaceae bacterium]